MYCTTMREKKNQNGHIYKTLVRTLDVEAIPSQRELLILVKNSFFRVKFVYNGNISQHSIALRSMQCGHTWCLNLKNKHTNKQKKNKNQDLYKTRGYVVLQICTSKTIISHSYVENIQQPLFSLCISFLQSWRPVKQAGRHTSSAEMYRVAKIRTYKTLCTAVTASSVQF